jgi:hypothetical protein
VTHFAVNATVSYIGWVRVEAESAEEALETARDLHARDFEVDTAGGQVEFNVTPAVEVDES